jgi:multidrug resistance efflux pump
MDIVRADRSRERNRRWILLGAAALAVVALLTLGVSRLKPAAPVIDRSVVVIETVRRGPMVREVRGTGTLVPVDANWIAATTDARVARIVTLPGSAVRRDTVILELADPAQVQRTLDARYRLAAGEADLVSLRNRLRSDELNERAAAARLKAEYEQASLRATADEKLAAQGVLSDLTRQLSRNAADELQNRYALESERLRIDAVSIESQLDAQRAKVEQLRAQSRLEEQQLASLSVRAGIEGVLQQINVEVGQRVAAGTVLARAIDPVRLMARLRIPDTQARDVAVDQVASIDTRSGVVKGHVMRIDPASQNATVTVDVALDGPVPRGARPDLAIDGTIELERIGSVLRVGRPVRAQEHASGSVFRVDGHTAVRVPVKFGRTSVTSIEIVEGLREGDQVITTDMSAWDEVDRVQIDD